MKLLLARILCSAAHSMWQKDPTLGKYTSETNQHELNLAFHYACELRQWFPWLDCDFDVSKNSCNYERPDIVLHQRGVHILNFLVIEVKREKSRKAVSADLKQIRERWFENYFRYSYGAEVILEDDKPEFEVQVLSRHEKDENPVIVKHSDMGAPLLAPNFASVPRETVRDVIACIVEAKQRDAATELTVVEQALHEMLLALYVPTPDKIKIVEGAKA